MKPAKLLCYKSAVGKQKIKYTNDPKRTCPFCDKESLQDIIAEDGPVILVKNKYQVLEDAYQLVLIETDNCTDEFSRYPPEHLHRVIRFGVSHWLQIEKSREYASVLFFKNYGPLSGGSIAHSHMQIVCLKNIDYRERISPDDFTGILIHQGPSVKLNLSTAPRVGFFEFNVILEDLEYLDKMADYLQIIVHYLLNYFQNCSSYNLFFYHLENIIYAKVIPRYITSPIFLGYSLAQVSDSAAKVVEKIQRLYF